MTLLINVFHGPREPYQATALLQRAAPASALNICLGLFIQFLYASPYSNTTQIANSFALADNK